MGGATLLSRRGLLGAIGALGVIAAAPAIVRAASIMPVRSVRPILWGDGVHDDTAALQALINSADGELFIPPGIYRVPGMLVLPRGFSLHGDGAIVQALRGDVAALTLASDGPALVSGVTAINNNPDGIGMLITAGVSDLSIVSCNVQVRNTAVEITP